MSSATPSYWGHRYPVEIIDCCVWRYSRFPLSFREVEELMLVCGVGVSCETIRRWCAKFGQAYANQLRRRRPRPGDKWHLDEVLIRINGTIHHLWRAVDQHGRSPRIFGRDGIGSAQPDGEPKWLKRLAVWGEVTALDAAA